MRPLLWFIVNERSGLFDTEHCVEWGWEEGIYPSVRCAKACRWSYQRIFRVSDRAALCLVPQICTIGNVSKKKKSIATLPGTVEKSIPPSRYAGQPEKAEIAVEGADPLYQEIRVENKLQDEEGKEVGLKPGAELEVTIEAEPHQTAPKRPSANSESEKPEKEEPEAV